MNEKMLAANKAIQKLTKNGWTRGTREDSNGACCLLGAIQFESGGITNRAVDSPIYTELYEECLKVLGDETIHDEYNGSVINKSEYYRSYVIAGVNNVLLQNQEDALKILQNVLKRVSD